MKSKLLYLSFLMLLNVATNYAQTSATQAGIAIQGIARDNNNTAMTSQSINLTFRLYYLDASNLEQPIFEETKSITTDAFGVFSYIINPTAVTNSKFANNIAFLRISKGTTIISDEKLNHVPYAIAANNGVPTGSIMPFMGTVAPEGWALCNGLPLPATATVLIAMVGANAPDLQGMFLRGAGKSSVNQQYGPALKATQDDALKSHLHGSGTLVNSRNGNHSHTTAFLNDNYDGSGSSDNADKRGLEDDAKSNLSADHYLPTNVAGEHTHTISGSTELTGDTETRPVNYGVNYIIKL